MPSMTRSFEILPDELTIELHEPGLTGDALGLKTWVTSFLLARQLKQIFDSIHPRPLRVLELGAGTGLVGIAHAKVFDTSVTMTDYLPEILSNLKVNIAANDARCDVELLSWADAASSPLSEQTWDLVIASDCIYNLDQPELLVHAVDMLSGSGTLLLTAYPLRPGNADIVADFENRLLSGQFWEQLNCGTMSGYDDFAAAEKVQCVWRLLKRT